MKKNNQLQTINTTKGRETTCRTILPDRTCVASYSHHLRGNDRRGQARLKDCARLIGQHAPLNGQYVLTAIVFAKRKRMEKVIDRTMSVSPPASAPGFEGGSQILLSPSDRIRQDMARG